MNNGRDDEMDATELCAAELVAHAKQIHTDELTLPIVDSSSVWAVTVKKLGIELGAPEPSVTGE
jgi:hypothetical protein